MDFVINFFGDVHDGDAQRFVLVRNFSEWCLLILVHLFQLAKMLDDERFVDLLPVEDMVQVDDVRFVLKHVEQHGVFTNLDILQIRCKKIVHSDTKHNLFVQVASGESPVVQLHISVGEKMHKNESFIFGTLDLRRAFLEATNRTSTDDWLSLLSWLFREEWIGIEVIEYLHLLIVILSHMER